MNRIKKVIIIILLFMVVGYATISVTLSINGNASIVSDVSDFRIYFSNILVNGTQDMSLVKNDTELEFDINIDKLGYEYEITYEITNASSVFDAALNVNCMQGDEVLSIVNQLDISTNLLAKSTRIGTLTLKKIKSNANESDNLYSVSCNITASPVSRNNQASGTIPSPVKNPYEIGTELSIGSEKFNVINSTKTTVTLLAQYSLGKNYRQSSNLNIVSFSSSPGWENTPGPKEIDLQQYGGNSLAYVNNYVSYLKTETGDDSLTGTLITLKELEKLGCTITADYSPDEGNTNCLNSEYVDWLINGDVWWTRSALSEQAQFVWGVGYDGELSAGPYYEKASIRPVITLNKEYFTN